MAKLPVTLWLFPSALLQVCLALCILTFLLPPLAKSRRHICFREQKACLLPRKRCRQTTWPFVPEQCAWARVRPEHLSSLWEIIKCSSTLHTLNVFLSNDALDRHWKQQLPNQVTQKVWREMFYLPFLLLGIKPRVHVCWAGAGPQNWIPISGKMFYLR